MKDIDYKILRFLLDGKAYSDGAVMKNLGINFEELQEIYARLEKEGYLESYESYLKRTKTNLEDNGCCGDGCSNCDNKIPKEDYKNIRVLTEKALEIV